MIRASRMCDPRRESRSRIACACAGLAIIVFSPACGARPVSIPQADPGAAGECAPGDRRVEVFSGGQARSFQIHVPSAGPAGLPAPLLFGFHGNGGRAEDFGAYSGFSALADEMGFIAIYPQGLGDMPTWDTWGEPENADVQFIRDLIDWAGAHCTIDRARVFASGHSRGGGMADRLACNLADELAAIGTVSGFYESLNYCEPSRPVPVAAFHGTNDTVVPYDGIGNTAGVRTAYFTIGTPIPVWAEAWAARNGCDPSAVEILAEGNLSGQAWENCRAGADVELYTIRDGGHGWPGMTESFSATRMIWDFLTAHPMPDSGSG